MKRIAIYIVLLAMVPIWGGCEREINVEDLSANEFLKELLEDWYLYYDQLPGRIRPGDYAGPEEMMDALKVNPPDRFSFVTTEEFYNNLFRDSQFIGIGISLRRDMEEKLRIGQVYKDSPGDLAGLTRGTEILSINGTTITPQTNLDGLFGEREVGVQTRMRVKKLDGTEEDITVIKAVVTQNTVVHTQVFEQAGKTIGYLVFDRFAQNSVAELNNAFVEFSNAGINELILDLRYNGGGLNSTANHLAGLIAPENSNGEPFVNLRFNDKRAEDNDRVDNIQIQSFNPGLNRLIVLTQSGTASASELLINGLRPYMEVITIGDITSGKPVGSSIFFHKGWAFWPITFRYTNSRDEGDFFDGLPPNTIKYDGLQFDFGDPEEYMLAEALYYIENGAFTGNPGDRVAPLMDIRQPEDDLTGFDAVIGRW